MRYDSDTVEWGISSSTEFKNETGDWRSMRPVTDPERCNSCMLCWLYCPEACVTPTEIPQRDMRYCKGCGICSEECPTGAITMVPEKK